MKNNLSILIWIVVLYYVLKYLLPFGEYVIYPFTLVVTVLHEFGHAFFALISWWTVKWIHIETNGSWYEGLDDNLAFDSVGDYMIQLETYF